VLHLNMNSIANAMVLLGLATVFVVAAAFLRVIAHLMLSPYSKRRWIYCDCIVATICFRTAVKALVEIGKFAQTPNGNNPEYGPAHIVAPTWLSGVFLITKVL